MKLIWHIARKDLRRLTLPLALFAAIIVSKLLLGGLLLRTDELLESTYFSRLQFFVTVASILEFVVSYILVGTVVHEDSQVGTKAFWMTRPIGRFQLLGAKLLTFLIALGLLPVVLTLPWWIACGFDFRQIAAAAFGMSLMQAVVVFVALPFAVLTGSLGRYLLGTILTLIAALLFATIYGQFQTSSGPYPSGAEITRRAMISLVIGLSVVSLVLCQFRTRRLSRSLGIAGMGAILAFVVLVGWRWDWTELWLPTESPDLGSKITVSLLNAEYHARNTTPLRTSPTITLKAEGIPTGHLLHGRFVDSRWNWSDDTEFETRSLLRETENAAEPLLRSLLGLTAPIDWLPPGVALRRNAVAISPPALDRFTSNVPVSRSILQRATKEPPSAVLDNRFDLLKPEVVAKVPLAVSSIISSDGRSLEVVALEKTDEQVRLSLIEVFPVRLSPRLFGADRQRSEFHTSTPELIVVDRSSGRAARPESTRSGTVTIGGVGIGWHTLTYYPSAHTGQKTGERAPREEADFHLAKIVYTKIATIRRTLHVPEFILRPVVPTARPPQE